MTPVISTILWLLSDVLCAHWISRSLGAPGFPRRYSRGSLPDPGDGSRRLCRRIAQVFCAPRETFCLAFLSRRLAGFFLAKGQPLPQASLLQISTRKTSIMDELPDCGKRPGQEREERRILGVVIKTGARGASPADEVPGTRPDPALKGWIRRGPYALEQET